MTRGLLVLSALWATAASAQPVFFDDFDGLDLLPHWRTPPASHWEYHVSGGMLHVTDLLFPSVPKLGANDVVIGASYEPQMDFRMDVWMGWERAPGAVFEELFVSVLGPSGGIMADFGLRNLSGSAPVVAATSGAGDVSAPPPPPGTYRFTIARTGSQFDFYLDGDHFGSLPDQFGIPAGRVSLSFIKPFPGEMNPKHVDRLRIVPAPGCLAAFGALALTCARRQRA